MIRFRALVVAAGYPDGNECDFLRPDKAFKLAVGRIVEQLSDGSFTVLVPSAPTPMAGSVYILPPHRVHPVDIPFTQAIAVFSKWGTGAGEFVRVMRQPVAVPDATDSAAQLVAQHALAREPHAQA